MLMIFSIHYENLNSEISMAMKTKKTFMSNTSFMPGKTATHKMKSNFPQKTEMHTRVFHGVEKSSSASFCVFQQTTKQYPIDCMGCNQA